MSFSWIDFELARKRVDMAAVYSRFRERLKAAPHWLQAVLMACETKCLDTPEEREQVAAAIIAAVPADPCTAIAKIIEESVAAVLHMHERFDINGDLAREAGNNAAANVLIAIALGEVRS